MTCSPVDVDGAEPPSFQSQKCTPFSPALKAKASSAVFNTWMANLTMLAWRWPWPKLLPKKGAVLLNHAKVTGFQKKKGRIQSASIQDGLHGDAMTIRAKAFVNATGPFSDALCRLDNPRHKNRLKPSQGVHLTFDADVLPGDKAVLIPKTSDGRVVFAVPWHGKVLIGTTDTAVDQPEEEPRPLAQEVDFVLDHANRHLGLNLGRKDIRSMFAGLRPLIKGRIDKTAALSRSHQIKTSKSGLTSVRGGKWTTYRKMAEDTLKHLKKKTKLRFEPASTQDMVLEAQNEFDRAVLPENESELTQAVLQAHRKEMCITVEDFLSRRRRILYLDARKAMAAAPIVARALASGTRAWRRMDRKSNQPVYQEGPGPSALTYSNGSLHR